ncbi:MULTISPECIES: hypothetical protein [unclassified Endozoicomonas]
MATSVHPLKPPPLQYDTGPELDFARVATRITSIVIDLKDLA